ncbi:MAG: hypothetical protein EA404_00195, partial [Spirochaetaceae bacterium]
FLIENSAQSLCDLLAELTDNPEKLARAGRGARETIYRHWDSVVDEVYQRYRVLADRHGKPSLARLDRSRRARQFA